MWLALSKKHTKNTPKNKREKKKRQIQRNKAKTKQHLKKALFKNSESYPPKMLFHLNLQLTNCVLYSWVVCYLPIIIFSEKTSAMAHCRININSHDDNGNIDRQAESMNSFNENHRVLCSTGDSFGKNYTYFVLIVQILTLFLLYCSSLRLTCHHLMSHSV